MKEQDCLRRFIFEDQAVRGEWVRLQKSWQQAKQFQTFPNQAVESQLGQALAAVVLLSATIKYKGSLILQIQGKGTLKLLVAQASHQQKIRGLVRCSTSVSPGTLKQMTGGGHLVLTVESENSEPYQGIVSLEQEQLSDMLRSYFTQSEQLKTRLWLFANPTYAAGLFIQELPDREGDQTDWERIEMLAATVTEEEMLSLACEEMLHRLFHEEKVRLYEAEKVEYSCHCSTEKIAETLFSLGQQELDSMIRERGKIDVDCQFCGKHYFFDKKDVETLQKTHPS